jgi:hypothetical protein
MLKLKDVTLVCVTSVKIEQNVKSVIKSMNGIEYGSVKFISNIKPDLPENVEYVECDNLTYDGFSEYTFLKLWKHIDTSHCLLVHHDGFVVRPDLWSDEFLEYDYVAAPWPYSETSYITDYGEHVDVGNGGFCLRSFNMLEMPTKLGLKLEERQGYYNDDGNYCVYHRKKFLENGIKYAPKEIASKFSTETIIPGLSQESFGFHSFTHHPQFSEFVK